MSARCKDREILRARLRADVRVYAGAIAVLQQRSIESLTASEANSTENFEKAHRLAEHARLAYQDSRKKLNQHIAAHGYD